MYAIIDNQSVSDMTIIWTATTIFLGGVPGKPISGFPK
jgi:hypothetical protein